MTSRLSARSLPSLVAVTTQTEALPFLDRSGRPGKKSLQRQSSVPSDPREHSRPQLFIPEKRKNIVGEGRVSDGKARPDTSLKPNFRAPDQKVIAAAPFNGPPRDAERAADLAGMFDLQPPRHISTLRNSVIAARFGQGPLTKPTAGARA
jgi:hypothetical protein